MKNDFPRALPRILVYEGGRVDNPRDPGGRTNKGITQGTFNAWLRENSMGPEDVYSITNDEVSTIYKLKYWDVVRGDDLPPGLDLCVFDGAVNSGPGQSGKWLQRALGDKFQGAIDGLIGAKTLQAIDDFGDVEMLINAYCSRRLATLHSLRTWSTFGAGWGARVANVQKTADAWAANEPAPSPVDVSAAGGHRKAPITDIKMSKVSQGVAHATTAVTGAGAVASNAAGQLGPIQSQFPDWKWLTYIVGGLTVISAFSGIAVKMVEDARKAAEAGSAVVTVNLDADSGHPQIPVNDANPSPVVILPVKGA